MDIQTLEQRIRSIENRNKMVELNKAWELSITRKMCIALLTYLVILLFFVLIGTPKPFVNAFVPTLGFILSTLSIEFVKKLWLKKKAKPIPAHSPQD